MLLVEYCNQKQTLQLDYGFVQEFIKVDEVD